MKKRLEIKIIKIQGPILSQTTLNHTSVIYFPANFLSSSKEIPVIQFPVEHRGSDCITVTFYSKVRNPVKKSYKS